MWYVWPLTQARRLLIKSEAGSDATPETKPSTQI